MHGYILRTVTNLDSTLDIYGFDHVHPPFEFLKGTFVAENVSPSLDARIQGVRRPFERGGQWAIYRAEPASQRGYDGDHRRFMSVQAIPIAMLLVLNPNLRFGPIYQAYPEGETWNFAFSLDDHISSGRPSGHWAPREFYDYDDSPRFEEVATVAGLLTESWVDKRSQVVREHYVRSCMPGLDDAILPLATILEILLEPDRYAKRKHLCVQSATRLGRTAEERATVYRDVGALYILRNELVHSGSIPRDVTLSDNTQLSGVSLIERCRRHIARLIRIDLVEQHKRRSAAESGAAESSCADEFAAYERQYFGQLR